MNKKEFLDFVETPSGWQELISNLYDELEQFLKSKGLGMEVITFLQVKEKFGSLRVYYNSPVDLDNIIDKYEILCEKTCAFCGKPATHMTTGYIIPLCNGCDK